MEKRDETLFEGMMVPDEVSALRQIRDILLQMSGQATAPAGQSSGGSLYAGGGTGGSGGSGGSEGSGSSGGSGNSSGAGSTASISSATNFVELTKAIQALSSQVTAGRSVIEDNWQSSSGASVTKVGVELVTPPGTPVDVTGSTQGAFIASYIEFTSGQNLGSTRVITACDAHGTLTLDTPLPYAPSHGDQFVIYRGTSQSVPIGSASYGVPATANTPLLAKPYTVPATGTVNVQVGIPAAGAAQNFEFTIDGQNYFDINGGNSLNNGSGYSFNFPVQAGAIVDFQFAADTTVGMLQAFFLPEQ